MAQNEILPVRSRLLKTISKDTENQVLVSLLLYHVGKLKMKLYTWVPGATGSERDRI